QRMPGDYLYYSGRSFKLREGSWGLIRVLDRGAPPGPQKLPGPEGVPVAADVVCPPGSPQRSFAVSVVEAPLPMLHGAKGKLYVLDRDRQAVVSGARKPEPLVLHADVGDCVNV